jgi:dihydrofolate reductase
MVTLHVVSSLDGFIAKKDNTISWMEDCVDVYERGVTDSGAEVLQSIGCYVMGSRTYEHALELGWPYGETPVIVMTRRELPSTRSSVRFCSGDLRKLIHETLAPLYANIWVVGGAELGQSFLRLGLVDQISLMIAPITLGEGLHLFGNSAGEQKWRLTDVVPYKNSYVALWYRR